MFNNFTLKELFTLLLFCLSIFSFNIFLEYQNYLDFKEHKHLHIHQAKILQSYFKTKKNRTYQVFKIQTQNFILYTTSFKEQNLSKNQFIDLNIITANVNFKNFLSKNFYAPSYKLKINENVNTKPNVLIQYFLQQHQSEKIIEFYGALFFALNVSSDLRNDVNYYGIAHLIAISGYHIGLIFSLIFFILTPIYSFFQKRYFPYRNLKLDLSIFIFVLLLAYAYLIGFVPSYIRSLTMAIWGFYLVCKNVKIINFLNLFLSICFCIALFPQLLFSVGFYFSTMGVFFIFLYMHHFYKYFNNFLNIIFLNFWTFFAMIIPVLYYFPLISYQQILSIPLSAAFVIFYPLVLILHFCNLGFVFDEILEIFFNFKLYGTNFTISLWIFLGYIFLALLSIRYRYLALFCIFTNFIPFICILI